MIACMIAICLPAKFNKYFFCISKDKLPFLFKLQPKLIQKLCSQIQCECYDRGMGMNGGCRFVVEVLHSPAAIRQLYKAVKCVLF